MKTYNWEGVNPDGYFLDKLEPIPSALPSFQKLFQVSATALSRSEERFSRNAETEIVCRLLLEKKKLRVWLRRKRPQIRHLQFAVQSMGLRFIFSTLVRGPWRLEG